MTEELAEELRDKWFQGQGNGKGQGHEDEEGNDNSESSGETLLLISDVRSVDYTVQSASEVQAAVKADMASQQAWHLKLRPRASMLKFRLPWDDQSSECALLK